jgi:hypothetical protein
MPIAKNNFSHKTNIEHGYPEYKMFTVDFINTMASEVGDPSASSDVAGLELVRQTIEQHCNILAEGPLADSGTQKSYIVRSDTAPAVATLQTDIRALNGTSSPGVTATISSATVTATDYGILTAAVLT